MPPARRPAWAKVAAPLTAMAMIVAGFLVAVFAVVALLSAGYLVVGGVEAAPMAAPACLISLALAVGTALLVTYPLHRLLRMLDDEGTWRRYYRSRRECPYCRYSLRGIESTNCPECGRDVPTFV